MKRLFTPFEYENLEEDFRMPYSIYGNTDYEVLKAKYMRLNNAPKSYLQRRFTIHQW